MQTLIFFVFSTLAESPADLIKKTEKLYRADSSRARMVMTIVNPNWKRTLEMVAWSEGEKKTLIRILSPKKEKGIATLRIDKEMWNYFPKINKVIKVPPSMMMGSWMGSDFNNDDLVKQSSLIEEYSIELKKGKAEWTFTLVPKAETATVWGKIEIITEPGLIPIRYNYFNERKEKVRTMEFTEKKKISNLMLPVKLSMKNLAKPGHETIIEYKELELNVPVKARFSLRHLKSKMQ